MSAKHLIVFAAIFGISWAQSEISNVLESVSLPPELQGKLDSKSVEAVQNKTLTEVMARCEKNGGLEAYAKAQNASLQLKECFGELVDPTVLQQEVEEAKPHGRVDEVFKKYCNKKPLFEACVQNFTESSKQCLSAPEQVHLKTVYNVSQQLAEFICFKDGDRIALFIAEGGQECFQDKQEGLQDCFNKTMNLGTEVDINAVSNTTLTFDEKQCNQIADLQTCVVGVLEKCPKPTSANIVESLFRFIRKATPCKNFSEPKKGSSANVKETKMPKRARESSQELIERYQRKIKRLEVQQKRKRRRIVIESSSDSDEAMDPQLPTEARDGDCLPDDAAEASSMPTTPVAESSMPTAVTEASTETGQELDPQVLIALGEHTGSSPKFGEKIHHSLAQRWEPILKKGLPKEAKDKLFKEYLVPENCTLLQAPKLNVEVAAGSSDAVRQRDKRKEFDQQQLGVGISAVNKALTLMLTSDDKIEAIRIISDACRILTDLHYLNTQGRINVINYALAKPFLNVVQDSERDDTLYGNKLAEKIKASKAIEKQGLSIKRILKSQKSTPSTEQAGPSTRPQYPYRPPSSYQGNWSGPPRFQQNRGGRREPRRTSHPANRQPLFQQASNAAGPNKPRQLAPRQ